MKQLISRPSRSLGALALLISTQTFAQDAETVYELRDFTVSSGPIAGDVSDFASPLSIMDEAAIRRQGGDTLGELLANQPGVSASSFGAGASRPIIRGFDGPRIRLLDSAIEAADASESSPDHAVATEPMLLERVEIIRGPATLLYGSSAIGGVVNVVGKEIPRAPVDPKGYEGAFETRYDTASQGETFLGFGQVGGDQWAVNVTALNRQSEDYKIPGQADLTNPVEPGRLDNSFVDTDAYSIGGTWFFGERNYLGGAFSRFDSKYGVPGEPVFIDLERDRFHTEMVLYDPTSWIAAARARFGYTDYTHTEFENGAPEAVFDRESWELRADASHESWALADEGVFGFQMSESDVSVDGDHPFIPASTTKTQAVFISEHIHNGAFHYEYGGRLERQDASTAALPDYDDVALSLATGVIWNFETNQSLALNLQRSQRHPTSTEAKDTYLYTGVDADFWGFEAEVDRIVFASTTSRLTIGLLADYVRAENRDTNEPLPRIPPLRIGLRADYETGPWSAGVLLRRAFNQDRVDAFETETSGYTELSLNVERGFDLGNGLRLTAFARADNLLDENIRHHTSFLKEIAPLPGRSAVIGARLEF